MWQEALNLAIKNGIWAVLFLSLLIYQLKDSKERETKYQNTIKNLNTSLGVVNKIKQEVNEVKEEVRVVKKSVKTVSGKVNKIDKNVVKLKSDVSSISQKIKLNETTS